MPANIGTGRAYGVEFYAEKRATSAATRLSGWASYTLGRAETTKRVHSPRVPRSETIYVTKALQRGSKKELAFRPPLRNGEGARG